MNRFLRMLRVPVTLSLALAVGAQSGALASATGLPNYSGPVVLPTNGAIFGVHLSLDDHNGNTRQESMANFEALVGRPMGEDRVFYLWDDAWPTADDWSDVAAGRLLYISWDAGTRDGGCVQWGDIASGRYDATIDAQADAIRGLPPFIFSFGHEPMTAVPKHISCGTYADYINAYRHVHDRFVADGITNVTYAFTVTAQSFTKQNAENYYPGDDVVDLIASDGYNWFGCDFHPGPWRTFQQVFQDMYGFGVQHNKYMWVAEYGTGEDPSNVNAKAQWFSDAGDQLKRWPLIKGVSYFNVGGGDCARYVDSSPESLASFQSLGDDPFTNPPMIVKKGTVQDFSFAPKTITAQQGVATTWTFNGPSNHTVTDDTGLGLFDSGSQAPGATFTYFFLAAGNYKYHCTINSSMVGKVNVPVLVSPLSGNTTTTFTVTWAADHAPTGYSFDVQIQRPGASWTTWLTGQTLDDGTFVPDAGTGTYSFRARYHLTGTSSTSQWSNPVSITVS